mgnify:CR=1 FL=1
MSEDDGGPKAFHSRVGTVSITRHARERFRERAITVPSRLPEYQLINRMKSSFAAATVVNLPQNRAVRQLRRHSDSVVILENPEDGIWFVVAILQKTMCIRTVIPAKDRKTGKPLFEK